MSENYSENNKPFSFLPPISILDAFLVLCVLFAGLFFSIFVQIGKILLGIKSLSAIVGLDPSTLRMLGEFGMVFLVFVAIYFIIFKKYHLDLSSFGFRRVPPIQLIGQITLGFIVTFVLWVIIATVIMVYYPHIDLGQSQNIFKTSMPIDAQVLLIIYAVFLGPLMEEVVFRGIILPAVTNKINIYFGVILSTLIWSLLHFQINVIIFTMIFGFMLSYLYIKTKSLWTCYLAHLLKNLLAVIAIYILWSLKLPF